MIVQRYGTGSINRETPGDSPDLALNARCGDQTLFVDVISGAGEVS